MHPPTEQLLIILRLLNMLLRYCFSLRPPDNRDGGGADIFINLGLQVLQLYHFQSNPTAHFPLCWQKRHFPETHKGGGGVPEVGYPSLPRALDGVSPRRRSSARTWRNQSSSKCQSVGPVAISLWWRSTRESVSVILIILSPVRQFNIGLAANGICDV